MDMILIKGKIHERTLRFVKSRHHTQGHPNSKKKYYYSLNPSHTDNGRLKYSTLANIQIIQTKAKERQDQTDSGWYSHGFIQQLKRVDADIHIQTLSVT